MAKFVSKQDIVREYSDTVAGLLATGWTIFTPTMGGSQGEEANIDLINAAHTVVCRVLLYKDSSWDEGCDHKYVISVHSYVPEEVHAASWDEVYTAGAFAHTIWNEKGTELSKRVFYGMPQGNSRYDFHYTGDVGVCVQARVKRQYKWKNGFYRWERKGEPVVADFNVDRLVRFVRKHGGRGYGNCKADEIKGVRKYIRDDGRVRYIIDFNGAKKQLAF